ncbi:MAG: DUF3734 domain-containing protein [Alphaproteobacteria bacterium]
MASSSTYRSASSPRPTSASPPIRGSTSSSEPSQGASSRCRRRDYEFSGTSMRKHWQSGLDDTARTLKHRNWLMVDRTPEGFAVYDVHRERSYNDAWRDSVHLRS